ncbi:MAG: 2-amino-4-hydroxy-6-hydroxymethyldihydropteridine diphosphokinase [Bacteroidota bacterium]
MTKLHRAIVMLGGNVGDTVCVFESALRSFEMHQNQLVSSSAIYRTKPWGYFNQRDFLNQLLVLDTPLDLAEFHNCCNNLELLHGKNKEFENGPRSLDIDILFFDDMVLENENLTIPHPRMHQRRFNLVPICEILPDFTHPILEKKMSELLAECTDLDEPSLLLQKSSKTPCS